MSLPPALRLEAMPGRAAMMRLTTIILALLMVVLGVLAAHHAQTAQGEASHVVVAELGTAHQPITAGSASSADTAGEQIAVGLATGCIVLIICCALGLALRAARAWRADLFRRLSLVAQPLRAVIGAARTALTTVARPSLIALSISRT